ncbi:MAG: hypothetical protein ACYC3W_07325 [Candidatus Nanopelagicales bacterium]
MSGKLLWRGSARSQVLAGVLLAIFALIFGLIVMANAFTVEPGKKLQGLGWLGPVLVLVLGVVAAIWSSRLAVEIDATELRVRFGPGWPVRRIPWSRVISVEYLTVHPLQWGGWGYRILPLRRAQAVVLRAGEGLRLELSNGSSFVLTVDQADQALDAIRALRSGM